MIPASEFINSAKGIGYDFYAGVPCSFLTSILNGVISDRRLDYVGAASEGEAVAIAAGAWLATRKTVVMCQNSGLGNAINPLTSLNHPFRIPTLFITTWRGQPELQDEPQHEVMGQITDRLLETMAIPHDLFPDESDLISPALEKADAVMRETSLPFVFIMKKDSLRDDVLHQAPLPSRPPGEYSYLLENVDRPSRQQVLERFLELVPDKAAVIATTGKCGRELFTLNDRAQHLYQVGSMGCAAGMGLGVALNTSRSVAVLDGDGASLMKMGTLATIGAYAPPGLVHIILDNGVHDSTGGQATVSKHVDFAQVALACGYARAASCDSLEGFERALVNASNGGGPNLIHMRITPGSMSPLGRPTIKPSEVARRFKEFLSKD
jgi:phosphonopyruvate decarboxylase